MGRRTRITTANRRRQLAEHGVSLARIQANDTEGSAAFAIQGEILGTGAGHQEPDPFPGKMAQRKRVRIDAIDINIQAFAIGRLAAADAGALALLAAENKAQFLQLARYAASAMSKRPT